MKRSRISRIMQILTALQTGKNNTVSDLSKMFGISRRTIFRDLKELQATGVPYYYDTKSDGYVIDPEFFLPPVDLNPQEAVSLLLLAHKVSKEMPLPFKRSALLAALKIENNLPVEVKQYCNAALRNISIKVEHQERKDLLDQTFKQLLGAILKKRIVSICYYLPHEQRNTVTDLSPYHLMYNEHAWYVLGKSSIHKEVRPFRLNYIRELNMQDKCFVEDEKFDVSEYLGRAWSMLPEGKLYNVKLRFLPEVAHNVAEVQWHNTQKVTFEDDGSAIIQFRVDGLSEITWWILSYGDQVQVLAPKVLRQKIVEIAQNAIKQNERLLPI
jgi:predicted DNA-binding transcriptional regulator YafY